MPLHTNNGELTSADKLDYVVVWFSEFSEMQKGDFLEILAGKLDESIEGANGSLTNGFEKLDLTGRKASIFACRCKLFEEWFSQWTEEERQQLVNRCRNLDADFVEKLDTAICCGQLPQSNLAVPCYELTDEEYAVLRQQANEQQRLSTNDSSISSLADSDDLIGEASNGNGDLEPATNDTGDDSSDAFAPKTIETNGYLNGSTENGLNGNALLDGERDVEE